MKRFKKGIEIVIVITLVMMYFVLRENSQLLSVIRVFFDQHKWVQPILIVFIVVTMLLNLMRDLKRRKK